MPKQKKKGNISEIGRIISFYSGVAKVEGLPHVFLHEVILDDKNNQIGIVIGFDEEYTDILIFDNNLDLNAVLTRSYEHFSIPLTPKYIGRIVNGLGQPLDGLGELKGKNESVFNPAPQIIDRQPVTEPLVTGIKIIDTSLPIGRGQRELIIGDRKLGKSTLVTDVVLNQKYAEVPIYCIYVLCGQKEQRQGDLIDVFNKHNAFLYSTIVSAPAGATLAEQYLAPFVGTTIGEYFRDQGKAALVIYDDLSMHAKVYRDISLLLERAPGREAYPGDIFSLHAGLLERSAKLSKAKGSGSLTALPIIETEEGDITSYIPTNLISITDGQVYLERSLFQKGFLPAIDIGLSVSRVGSKAQPATLRDVVSGLRLILSQHKDLQKLLQLETDLSEETKQKLHRGELILELLKQYKHTHFLWEQQAVLFYAVQEGLFDDFGKEEWEEIEDLILEVITYQYPKVLKQIKANKFDDKVKKNIKEIIDNLKQEYILAKNENISNIQT